MTQGELAERARLCRMTVTRIELGKRDPPISTVVALAGALGTTVEGLLGLSRTRARKRAA